MAGPGDPRMRRQRAPGRGPWRPKAIAERWGVRNRRLSRRIQRRQRAEFALRRRAQREKRQTPVPAEEADAQQGALDRPLAPGRPERPLDARAGGLEAHPSENPRDPARAPRGPLSLDDAGDLPDEVRQLVVVSIDNP